MSLSQLLSQPNLELAFQRISTSTRPSYKNQFREIYQAYSLSSQKNLAELRRKIQQEEFDANESVTVFYPKPSGLQRTFRFLSVEDQIVLQAFSNLVAKRVYARKKKLDSRVVFSHYLLSENSPFFFQEWQRGYEELQNKIFALMGEGFTWIASFDLAAYYDSIDHEILLRLLYPRSLNSRSAKLIRDCLRIWASQKIQQTKGIPQGPAASDLLGEAFLIPIDEILDRHYKYLRYADNFYVLGKTRSQVQQASVHLDILCKQRGLTLQVSGTRGIATVKSNKQIREMFSELWSYSDPTNSSIKDPEEVFWESLTPNGKSIRDRTKFRFSVFRMPPKTKVLNSLLRLLPNYPEHIDAISFYFSSFDVSKEIAATCAELIRTKYPYDYVIGECWRTLARIDTSHKRALIDEAIETIKAKRRSQAAVIGAAIYFASLDRKGLGKYSKWIQYLSPISQAIVAPFMDPSTESGRQTAKLMLRRTIPDPGLALLRPFVENQFDVQKILENRTPVQRVVSFVYEEMGLIYDPSNAAPNPLGHTMKALCSVPLWDGWEMLLGIHTRQTHELAIYAKTNRTLSPSSWLLEVDAISDLLVRGVLAAVNLKLKSKIYTIGSDNLPIDYGVILKNARMKKRYPVLTANLLAIHNRRNRIPDAHPFDKKTGKPNQWLNSKESRKYAKHFRDAILEIIHVAQAENLV